MFELVNKAFDALKKLRERRNPPAPGPIPAPPAPLPGPVPPSPMPVPVDPDDPTPPVPPAPIPVPVVPGKGNWFVALMGSILSMVSRKWLLWAMMALIAVVAGRLGLKAPVVPPAPDVPIFGTGWVEDPEAVRAVRATLQIPDFADTPAGKVVMGDGDIPLWKTAIKVTGSMLPARNQGQVGSCVSFGTATAVEYLQLSQIALGENLDFKPLVQEQIYGVSRVEIGGGRIGGDGSVGAWAADGVKRYGVLARGKYLDGKYDLSSYSESRCRDWGRRGMPDELETASRDSLVKTVSQVKSAAECKKAIGQGYPVAVCSNRGFGSYGSSGAVRDRDGNLAARGTWNHCMAIVGYRAGARPSFLICNSWGANWVSGPMGSEPIPDGCFWADESIVDGMLRQGDSWAFSDAVGFPGRQIDWFVFAAPRKANGELFASLRGIR